MSKHNRDYKENMEPSPRSRQPCAEAPAKPRIESRSLRKYAPGAMGVVSERVLLGWVQVCAEQAAMLDLGSTAQLERIQRSWFGG